MKSKLEEAKNRLFEGALASAENIYIEILEKDPVCIEALHGLSLCLFQQKKHIEAKELLHQARQLSPQDPELSISFAIVCQHLCLWQEAALALEQARSLFSQNPAHFDKYLKASLLLADIYLRQQKHSEAKIVLKEVLTQEPENIEVLKRLAQAYVGQGKYHLAIQTLARFITDPLLLEALKIEIYFLKKDFLSAEKCAERCIELDPKRPIFYNHLGYCQIKTYKIFEAVATFKKGLTLDPDHPEMLGRLLALQVRTCEWEERPEIIERLRRLCAEDHEGSYLKAVQPTIAILAGFSNAELLQITTAQSASIEQNMAPIRQHLNFVYKRAHPKKLRIAYLSNDFHHHATLHLMLDVFRLHDRRKFEVYAYSYGVKDRGAHRRRVERDCDRFFDVRLASDVDIAKQIHDDRIDLLIDLKGHIADHRLGILALRPAPIQLHYLGYPGTIGASFIDYLIADKFVIPESERSYYSEKLVYMPLTYQANTAEKLVRKKPLKRADYGLPEEAFVYCCFNQNDKFDPDSVLAWMSILHRVPRSVLWLWTNCEQLKDNIEAYAKRHGIDPRRIFVSPSEPVTKHLARIALADLFLDTFCYSAHTSCSDAIWMGLPVLALAGKTFASLVAASLLSLVGVQELIVQTQSEYIEKAVFFANHPDLLQKIRARILGQKSTSGLFDPIRFTHALDRAYLEIWKDYQEGSLRREITIEN